MKTVVCVNPFEFAVQDRDPPQRQAGEVLIRVRRIGICGSDYHIYNGRQPFLTYPRVIGHELGGEVVAADPGSPLRTGQIVTVNPYLPCGKCIACRRNKPNCCVNVQVLGVHADGAMCEFLVVPERAVLAVDELTLDQAAMVEFLAIGAHAVRRGTVTDLDRVLVIGAGAIGMGVALFAKRAGASVTLIDTSAERLARARDKVGIADVRQVDDGIDAWLQERTGGEFFDCVFEATGSIAAMRNGLNYVAHGGRYVLVSVVMDDLVFPDPEFHKRETTLLSSRNATDEDFRLVISCMIDGSIPTDALHTQSFAALDAETQIPALIASRDSVLKAIAVI